MTPAPADFDVRITGPAGERVYRFRPAAGNHYRLLGYVVTAPPPHLPAAAVSLLPDGRYLCDAGPFDLPDLYAAAGPFAGSADVLPKPMGGDTPHGLPNLDGTPETP